MCVLAQKRQFSAVRMFTHCLSADMLCCLLICSSCRGYTFDRYEPKIYALYHTRFQQVGKKATSRGCSISAEPCSVDRSHACMHDYAGERDM
jgi:hypothetical protein